MLSMPVGEIGKPREALLTGSDDPLRCIEDGHKVKVGKYICLTAMKTFKKILIEYSEAGGVSKL